MRPKGFKRIKINLCMNKHFIIVNPNSNSSKEAILYLKSQGISHSINSDLSDISSEIKDKIYDGFNDFIVVGGDGTINKFVNNLMKLSKNERKGIRMGIIPSGRANDLARNLGIPMDIKEAIKLAQD